MGGAANWTEVAVGAAADGISTRVKKKKKKRKGQEKKKTDWSESDDLGLQGQDKHNLTPDRASNSSRTRAIVSRKIEKKEGTDLAGEDLTTSCFAGVTSYTCAPYRRCLS